MKKIIYFFSLILLLVSCADKQERITKSFNEGWTFHLGDIQEASSVDFDDSSWRNLQLPHDWAIEGEFSADNPAEAGGGALPGGIGWYRKSFMLDKSFQGKKVFIDFDGVYMNSDVWINGNHLGYRPFGYISFRYDLTPYLRFDQPNIIAVRVDNSEQPNSRWYSGCGIYRNVWITFVEPVYVDLWGTYVTTPKINEDNAEVLIKTSIRNETPEAKEVNLVQTILDARGIEVAIAESNLEILANSTGEVNTKINLKNPRLWTLEHPYLYSIITKVFVEGRLSDNYKTPLGVRSFYFDADKGFFLNGEHTKIKGVCMHHDLGCLGAAVNTRAIERQLEILKDMGVNGIRTSHNPPAPELLDLCDRMGFIVQNETFDMWRKRKTKYDYSRYFNEWHERDLRDHILRDRNHPSVFMWSIGNEVLEQWTHADADTLDLQQANLLLNLKREHSEDFLKPSQKQSLESSLDNDMSINSLLTIKLANIVRELDPTRPITAGNNEPRPYNHLFKSGALDIIGFNYHEYEFENVSTYYPGMPFIAAETTSALATRGYYRMPSDSTFVWPIRWDIPFSDTTYSCSSYDNCHVPWGLTHEKAWLDVKKNDFISGMYIWTGFDYIGEPTPYGFPARSSYFGIVDLAGFPKDVYYMYQSEWTNKDVLHVFPHWNWKEGDEVDIWAYYNNADEVELFLNGVSQGIRKKEGDTMHVVWRLNYIPGVLKVVSRKDGQEVLSREIKTASEPFAIRLTPDKNILKADGCDLSFITIEVLDKDGNLCPNADNLIHFDVSGKGKIVGVDNGSQTSMESFKDNKRKAFYGKCLVVVQSTHKKGKINLSAWSDGLRRDDIVIRVK